MGNGAVIWDTGWFDGAGLLVGFEAFND